ncbi:MAG: TetR/AcrR family transcriptional regulator [Mycolicibacterium sp.]|uniref:TetR/AcrR family transcriptional regulator n=1 Tax=Mycolicibacterium sp. TaxID=2320850 RepID=UPI003D13F216
MSDPGTGMRRAPVQARSQDSTDRMLDAALIILDRAGAAGLTISAVSKEAAVSTGTIYHRFRGRRALLIAAHNRFLARLEEQFITTSAPIWDLAADDDFLLELLETFDQTFSQHRNAFRAFMVASHTDADIRERGTESGRRFAAFLIEMLTQRFSCSHDAADSAFRIIFAEAVLGTMFTSEEVSASPADRTIRLQHLRAAIRALLEAGSRPA